MDPHKCFMVCLVALANWTVIAGFLGTGTDHKIGILLLFPVICVTEPGGNAQSQGYGLGSDACGVTLVGHSWPIEAHWVTNRGCLGLFSLREDNKGRIQFPELVCPGQPRCSKTLRCVQECKCVAQGLLKQRLEIRKDAQGCPTDTKHLCLDRIEL